MKITLTFGEWYDRVEVDGKRLDPGPSQRLWNHSPDGFAWGYGGSGPAQLALAILLAAGIDDQLAVELHQAFKKAHVSHWPKGDFETEIDMDEWALFARAAS